MSARRIFKRLLYCFVVAFFLVVLPACAWIVYRTWPRPLQLSTEPRFPAPAIRAGRLVLPYSPAVAAAEVATFNDQLEAFLRFEYLRGRDPESAPQVLLTATHTGKGPSYKIFILLENDLLTAVPRLTQLESRGLIPRYELITWSSREFDYYRQQSQMFDSAYDVPTKQKLETLSSFQLLPALSQFLIFKSQTDVRVTQGSVPTPLPLTREQATSLASDILLVANFYFLPLDYFLGVGAMENNYMDANGDLTHAVWKKRAQRDDIVLRRSRKRVMVSNYSIGTWQITRETLRAAHVLYLKDKRDYNLLPARLRPPRELDVNSVSDAVLTTYAGLLLRDLLDHFGGNVDKAIGAYNGGVKTPNPAYASGVKTVADYARRILEHASALDDPSANGNGPAKSQSAPSAAPPPNAPQQKHPWRRADD